MLGGWEDIKIEAERLKRWEDENARRWMRDEGRRMRDEGRWEGGKKGGTKWDDWLIKLIKLKG